MDREWMRQRLEKYVALCQEWQWSLYGDRPPEGNIDSQINAEIPTVKEIMKRLDPDLVAEIALPGDKTTRTWRSQQNGLQLLATGAFAGIRNVATHTADEWVEQVALEHLAVLSVVARWTDQTEVVTPSLRLS
jgi:hypothetical protein